ncbi:hypothetical protein [Saccharolobus islandicus]|uniref:Uncharacterized protein n=1 Tax=Saccharolobus islandicus (strain M.14.25 / Kamchatka \|nr:hypothetical protein [Sulfolobus islandicus]ACP37419.1 conserved hypothetical protein [Sulfolobus islandicus M.14.25]
MYIILFFFKFLFYDISLISTTTALFIPILYTPTNLFWFNIIFTSLFLLILTLAREKFIIIAVLYYIGVYTLSILLQPLTEILLFFAELGLTAVYIFISVKKSSGIAKVLWGISSLTFPLTLLSNYFSVLIIPSIIGAYLNIKRRN